jgi:pyruvate dehydrogenase E1 component
VLRTFDRNDRHPTEESGVTLTIGADDAIAPSAGGGFGRPDLETLDEIQRRVLWLAVRIVDAANRRPKDEIKVGGHQASSASMVSLMTALWFHHLDRDDRVAVKPHASPVFHAIQYLLGRLDGSYLTRLRERGGLQAYPSRTKDPDHPDFSTGSVGLGAVAPLFAAAVRRYVDDHAAPAPRSRFIALVGDAELDEGNVWEAVSDPSVEGLGNFTLVVDLNRQSLDRVVPAIQEGRLAGFFRDAGWHVVEAKYGSKLQAAFARDGGDALRRHLDAMPNEAYQSLFALRDAAFRARLLEGADAAVTRLVDEMADDELYATITDLGGHDLGLLLDAFAACDREGERPSVVFAYTIKGWGLPIAGDPMNHAALLNEEQIDELRASVGLAPDTEWDRFLPDSTAGRLCARAAGRTAPKEIPPRPIVPVPSSASTPVLRGKVSSQEAFGRALTRLADVEGVGERIVTTAPDVSISTNLGGWINKAGVYSHTDAEDYGGAERVLRWAPGRTGQHLELGISEMNLFMLLGQLGLSHEYHGHHLLPVGTVYDPFVLRGLDALVYGLYNGSRFVFAGTPAGVTLASEGGAHQSTITASVGLELPQLTYAEPCFATEVDWLLCDALAQLGAPDGASTYLRLSTRPIDQEPFAAALDRYGEDRLRQLVLAGGYELASFGTGDRPGVTLVTTGVMVPEVLAAAAELDGEGVDTAVVHLTSPDRAYRSWQGRHRRGAATGTVVRAPSHLHQIVGARRAPIVSVHDGASHALGWLGSALGVPQLALGVDQFGQSGTIADLHELTGISTGNIVNAALIAVHESGA